MSDKESSSLKSYVDSATGAAQSALGSLTGNTENQVRFHGFHTRSVYQLQIRGSHSCTQDFTMTANHLCLLIVQY